MRTRLAVEDEAGDENGEGDDELVDGDGVGGKVR